MATLSQFNSFTSGELGDYTLRFAKAGLIALAVANGPVLVAVPGAKDKTYSTNPLSFAAPSADGIPLMFDRACSAAAFVNIAGFQPGGSDAWLWPVGSAPGTGSLCDGIEQRLESQLTRLAQMGVHRPEWERQHSTINAQNDGISVPVDLLDQLIRM
ncbi:Ldh family oxidoreductase [Pseudomonas syringae]|uniref:Ldh family oxidoreductase n=1 Tax=Pseudomonas syringae TaxID=317 RepID=UPI0024BEB7BC|nr:Ldh family oxidoreductase [Pseudomonas syringae]